MRPLLPLLLLAGCGKSEQSIRTLVPVISVTPPAVDFGEVPALMSAEELVYVANTGQATLEVELSLEGDDADQFALPVDRFEIARGEQPLTLPITFTPQTYLPYTATLVVTSNDKENPRVEVPLTGEGIYAPTPDICVDPLVMDWGDVAAGSSVPMVLSIENCGDDVLDLGTIDQEGSGAFRVDLNTDPSGAKVTGGETQPVVIYYEPTHENGDNGTLRIPSNDPDEPEVSITLLGNGGGDFEYPVAVIDCPGTAAPPVAVQLDGSGSYDPNNLLPLQYSWTLLSRPDGSQAELSDTIIDTTSFFADLGGIYEVQLQVANAGGVLSAPERCTIDAVPLDDLHVELTWDTNNVDLDLHLLQSPQAEMYDVPDDCTWCNKNPDWGSAGASDDPRLDLDDRADGPENINILDPAPGGYPVIVHYYDPIGGPATTATVKVYTYGVEVFSASQILTRNDVWEVGQVNWPDGTFGAFPVNITSATRRTCQ